MLLHKKTQKVIINSRDPDRIIATIPTAKKFNYKGKTLVAVPFKITETRILRNMGFKVPSPIRYFYEWSGQHKPFAAQETTAEFLTLHPRAFCLNDMGTGKTMSNLWAYDYLRSQGDLRKVLVIAPLSTLERTWGDEIFRHFPHLNFVSLYGSKERRLKLLAQDADVYLVNHDGVKVIMEELAARDDIDLVILDESGTVRNASTDRWKAIKHVTTGKKAVWANTGTPTPNAPTDAWAQCRLICPENVPPYFGKFKEQVMRHLNQFKWVAREDAADTVFNAMQPAIRFSRTDCVDLPPCVIQTRHVPLSPEQKKVYNNMLSKLAMEHDGEKVLAVNEAVKIQKLVQIACGVVYGEDHSRIHVFAKPRLDVVREIIDEAGTKVIVFVPFKGVLAYVASELAKTLSVATISGDTPKAERDNIFHRFQQEVTPRIIVASPGTMSHGLTLTAASTVIWFAPINSNDTMEQANARVSRPGQKHKQLIVNIEGTEVERRIYSRVKGKQKLQGLLLDLVRER